ncbi:uncharacterized protein TRIVIDRAFT_215676 [Trichoderma virens Gv29-8]|uniref:F-box domain-containing protein n=1 Tax=Hypocrea virens (strain Gv29-8 / FGSC 10586) TaxID=413071 RepID=G9MKQ0_HYPVG|nr:uncharacterized protein TRIVIDRAFT_215676 [Trichoderma virens Gv29-8]EHK24797.1 hypothetical protein TRIVIDRAFT_215676 [Trichoderma virens Gv29-8]UKZ55059.1 hypothetical protein TrVGV298_008876 [Trichoderma virens]
MACLSALPQELTLQIFQLLEVGDKIRLSATCKHYRAQLAPEIFKTIRLTNDERVAQSALAAIEAHGEYTTRIEFKGHCEYDSDRTEPALPPAAARVLQGHLTPNLRTVSLGFTFDFEDGDEWDEGHPDASGGMSIYLFEGEESEEYVRERERTWQWRALMNETWQALIANIHVRELILDKLIPKWTSTFRTEEFRQLLSRLEFATFNILGTDNGAGWKTNTVWGYVAFLQELDTSFFHHMTGLKHLTIRAKDPLGLEGFRHIPLALKPEDLPLLESLKLMRCFVGPELVSFIRGHKQVLKSLDVKECVSAGESGSADNGISWAEFLDQVYEAKPALTELIAGGGRAPLTREEEFTPDYQFKDEPEDIQEIRRKLKADPRLRLFGYGSLDDKYGMFFLDEDANEEEFKSGNDQKAFDRLMGHVNQNAAKAKQ